MATRMLPARHIGKLGRVIAEPKQQLGLGEMVTCEAARVLHTAKQRRKAKRDEPSARDLFDFACRSHGLPPYRPEHLFAAEAMQRNWRFDFAWPQYKLAVEVEGLVVRRMLDPNTREAVTVVTGGHATITGMREDFEKYNAAAILGWYLLRFEQSMIKKGEAIAETMRFLCARGWQP